MKWLLELGSCWGGGGATVTPAAEAVQTSSTRQPKEVVNGARVRGRSSTNKATAHWKPKLHVISEDNVVTTTTMNDVERRRQLRSVGSHQQPSVRVKPKPNKVKVSKTSHAEDYWKSSHPIPLAAFSPAPFLF